jgi:transcriptional regulator with XRE-family HTH domain
MKLERSKEWWMARAAREGNHVIMAGVPGSDEDRVHSLDSVSEERSVTPRAATLAPLSKETHIVFGRFVNLMRRRRGLTIEAFASETQIDAGELLAIEDDVHYVPEPRTVYRLALAFKVAQERLMQLAGLAEARDSAFHLQAVRFAASADPVKQLSREENAALENFVAVLSKRDSTGR